MAFVVSAKWIAKDGEEDAVADAITHLIEPSRAEPGMLLYQCHRDPEDSRVFFLYEQYKSQDDYQAHLDSPHFQEYGFGQGIPHLEDRERKFYETWDGN